MTGPEHQIPRTASEGRAENPRWNEAAEGIGRTAARAVAIVREFPRRVDDAREQVQERLAAVRSRPSTPAPGKLVELKEAADRRMLVLKNRATEKLHLARSRAERLQRERPLELIVGAFGAAFLLGVALRIWRSNRG